MKRLLLVMLVLLVGCTIDEPAAKSGLTSKTVSVNPGADGFSVEQRNIRDRLSQDNKPGAIQHLYVISAYSGQVLLYSTVRGKVTSSGKRLSQPEYADLKSSDAIVLPRLGDDGAYGESVEYIYWWDSKGIYHQHYITGGQIVHISSEPIAVHSVVLNLEQR